MDKDNNKNFFEIETTRRNTGELDIFGPESEENFPEASVFGADNNEKSENSPELQSPYFKTEDWVDIEENRRLRREARQKRKTQPAKKPAKQQDEIELIQNDFPIDKHGDEESSMTESSDDIRDFYGDFDEDYEETEEEIENRKRLEEKIDRTVKLRKRFYRIIILITLAFTTVFLFYTFIRAEKISVNGNINYADEYIVALSGIKPGDHIFSINRSLVADNIMRDPRLRLSKLRYVFPNGLNIIVKERIPAGAIKISTQYVVIDEECNALEMSDSIARYDIPVINGIGVTSSELGYVIRTDDSYKLTVAQNMLHFLNLNEITEDVNYIELSDINSITIQMKSEMKIEIGQGDRLNEKLAWAKAILETLRKEGIRRGTIDVSTENSAIYKEAASIPPSIPPANTEDNGDNE